MFDSIHRIDDFRRIVVQIDGNEFGVDQSGSKVSLQVFPSTTIHDLRALVNSSTFLIEIIVFVSFSN